MIRNCLLDKGHGGIVIGSEMSGGVKDMVVTQCLMDLSLIHISQATPSWWSVRSPPPPLQAPSFPWYFR